MPSRIGDRPKSIFGGNLGSARRQCLGVVMHPRKTYELIQLIGISDERPQLFDGKSKATTALESQGGQFNPNINICVVEWGLRSSIDLNCGNCYSTSGVK